MRYHWGLGIGHKYSHANPQSHPVPCQASTESAAQDDVPEDEELPETLRPSAGCRQNSQELNIAESSVLQGARDNDPERGDSGTDGEDEDVDFTGSQDGDYDRARFVGGSDDGDSEEELELYDTYNHPD